MPIPAALTDLNVTPNLNSPQSTESAKGTIDDYFRAHASFIRQTYNLAAGATTTLPSAATVNIGFAATNNIAITGSTPITAFDNYAEGAIRIVQFSGAMLLTHNAASLILPGSSNITTASGDTALFKSLGAGNWKCVVYQSASGLTASGAIGYGAGSGGAVTQITSKATGVTLNKPTGQITMNAAALAAGASVEFVFNNALLASTDILLVQNQTASLNYNIWARTVAGAAVLTLKNISAGSLSEALVINFVVIKGVAS